MGLLAPKVSTVVALRRVIPGAQEVQRHVGLVADDPRVVTGGDVEELAGLHDALFGKTPRIEWITVDGELAAELQDRLAALGYHGELDGTFRAWAGKENLEERVDGIEHVDPVVLKALREAR